MYVDQCNNVVTKEVRFRFVGNDIFSAPGVNAIANQMAEVKSINLSLKEFYHL